MSPQFDAHFYVINKAPADVIREIINAPVLPKEKAIALAMGSLSQSTLLEERKTNDSIQRIFSATLKKAKIVLKVNMTDKIAPDGRRRMAFICGVYRAEDWRPSHYRRAQR